jgi:Predicted NADH:ubiquinone oxidoreductase, subunit RnfB
MIWLNLLILLVIAVAAAFGASFLTSGWRKRRKDNPGTLRVDAMLPGHECGLCGYPDCRSYAAALGADLSAGGVDPALCIPGGDRLESLLRGALAESQEKDPAPSMRAVVRCGGSDGAVAAEYPFDGRRDCRSVAELMHGGPKRCKDGCVGYGSCVSACPLGAIRVSGGLARIIPALCTGCGACVSSCPRGVIELLPRQVEWYVACSSKIDPEKRGDICQAACTACEECRRSSKFFEFAVRDGMARESHGTSEGRWSDIAERCPAGAIVRAGAEKKRLSGFRKSGR